ncbi:MAG TPA: MopE-related protein [Polyangia bacterium]
MPRCRPLRAVPVVLAVALAGCGATGASLPPGAGADGGAGRDANPAAADGGHRDGAVTAPCAADAPDLVGCACDLVDATRSCWPASADPGVRGVGACRDGAQTCIRSDEFTGWGACTGAVLPAAEICGGGGDEDCDGRVDCADEDCGTEPACVPECQTGATQPCYSGPPGTSGVGVCHPGIRTCDAAGHWGACTGEVTPGASEGILHFNCGDGLDNDCNGKQDCDEFGCLLAGGCAAELCTANETKPCYTGAAGTAGVGPCHGGTQTCASDGKSWGPCVGEVTPTSEGLACTDSVDNDCDGRVDCADPACATAPSCCTPPSGGPVDETIWAHSATDLYRVDPVGFGVTHVGAFGAGDSITDIAVTPAGDLWAISFSALYRVDRTTAAATFVASVAGSSNNGLTFLSDGTLLAASGAGDVVRIDPATGGVSTVGGFGHGLSSSGDLVAVGGVMYGISSTGSGGSDASSNNVLLRVDVATGAATVVGPIGFGQVWGLAYVNARVIAFNTSGQIIQIDPQTGAGTLLTTRSVQFWGAGMSPNVPANPCP